MIHFSIISIIKARKNKIFMITIRNWQQKAQELEEKERQKKKG